MKKPELLRKGVVIVLVVAALVAQGCSRKGVYMPRNRKAHRCNTCPTFSLNEGSDANADTLPWQ